LPTNIFNDCSTMAEGLLLAETSKNGKKLSRTHLMRNVLGRQQVSHQKTRE